MPNLVGIGNSQVPTNAMLGGLAYQDSVGEINIEKIKARTSDTALSVFVYDTRKDSDGGAWRYRTQNTSWYNEVVSAERGARREFPSVAVIVVASTVITIYDGDNPNLPMWMVLKEGGSLRMLYSSSGSDFSGAVSALNGNIYYGMTGNGALGIIEFVRDSAFKHRNNNRSNRGRWRGTIADRNLALGWSTENDIRLAGEAVSDIATTVLPNAPIETFTGLPVPTIAAATNDGVSVIKDNGIIVDGFTSITVQTGFVGIDKKSNKILYAADNSTKYKWIYQFDIPSKDNTGNSYLIDPNSLITDYNHNSNFASYSAIPLDSSNDGQVDAVSFEPNKISVGTDNRLALVHFDDDGVYDSRKGLLCLISSSYNTGWQTWNIKGAFLSSTDDTNLTSGNNIVNNGTFNSNASGWYGDSGAAISWDSGGFALVTNGGGDNTYAIAQSGILVVGKKYRITGRVNPAIPSGSYEFRVRAGGSSTSWNITSGLTNGSWYSFDTGVVTADGTSLEIGSIGGNMTSFYIDDVVVKEFDDDRSVQNNGLQVFGTVTKSPVATGAELVSYDSLTSSNYLEQPYNSDLNFGTGDFCMMGWFYNLGTSASILYRLHNSTSAGIGYIVATSSGGELGYSSYTQGFQSTGRITHYTSDAWNGLQNWNMFICGKKNGVGYMYVNGELKQSSSNANSHTDTTYNPPLRIGNNHAGNGGIGGGKLALIRISSGFPTEEQIKKIYNDEKCLFHENAKCTLYGTSDAVTALAYDDTTNILHAGTSSGRSEFQGLNRINNTTTAVTTAISVSDGFVAEQ